MTWLLIAIGVFFFFALMRASIYAAAAHDKLDGVDERLKELEAERKAASG